MRSEFFLCLPFKLQQILRNPNRKHRRKSLPNIATFQVLLFLLQHPNTAGIFIKHTRHRGLHTSLMRARTLSPHVINKTQDVLRIPIVKLERHRDLNRIVIPFKRHNWVQHIFALVNIFHKILHTIFKMEFLFHPNTLVYKLNLHPFQQECGLTQALRQRFIIIRSHGKNRFIRFKTNRRTSFVCFTKLA
ncbi:Uncharacterised protein [Listeria newyorkensis]|nr:Uncharacterised protein [Listeria newyorkensis]